MIHATLIILKPLIQPLRPLWEIVEQYSLGEYLEEVMQKIDPLIRREILSEPNEDLIHGLQRNLIDKFEKTLVELSRLLVFRLIDPDEALTREPQLNWSSDLATC